MRLKDEYFGVIKALADTSTELLVLTEWSRKGFSPKDYYAFLTAVDDFLHVIVKTKPQDLYEP